MAQCKVCCDQLGRTNTVVKIRIDSSGPNGIKKWRPGGSSAEEMVNLDQLESLRTECCMYHAT